MIEISRKINGTDIKLFVASNVVKPNIYTQMQDLCCIYSISLYNIFILYLCIFLFRIVGLNIAHNYTVQHRQIKKIIILPLL